MELRLQMDFSVWNLDWDDYGLDTKVLVLFHISPQGYIFCENILDNLISPLLSFFKRHDFIIS
jgi:hypothetical protein